MNPYDNYRRQANYPAVDGGRYGHQYKLEGPEIQSLIGENPQFFDIIDVDLSTAQPFTSVACELNVQGHGIVAFGYTTATKYNPVANTGIETNATNIFIACRFQQNQPSSTNTQAYNEFHLKHARGYWGAFARLYLAWPAQANNSAKIYIFKSKDYPYFSGEAAT